ncbi:hypothetical protein ACF09C_29425 [Streptomyces sp. NPDC014870]|uniref:hypothetical protein n=1 Tax=Streptomyces sp. NPDC014870 TaxID=3364925 RepID=UPI0036F5B54D
MQDTTARIRIRRAAAAVLVAAVLLTGCGTTAPGPTVPPTPEAQDALLKSVERTLVDRCLEARGLTLARRPDTSEDDRRLQAALFGSGPRELSLTLATGHTVTAHTDGCLASAREALYGDQTRWFRAEVTVNNLRSEAQDRMKDDPAHRAALARWNRCATPPGTAGAARPDPAVVVRCDKESGLAGVRARLEPVELAHVRALRGDQLTTYQQLRTRALRRAVELSAPATAQEGTNTL